MRTPKGQQMIFRVFLLFVCYVLTSFFVATVMAAPVLLNGQDAVALLPTQAETLEDETGELLLAQILSPAVVVGFERHTGTDLNFGQTESAWWLRFTLYNASEKKWYLLIDAMLGGDVDLFVFPKQAVANANPPLLTAQQLKRLSNYRRVAWSLAIPHDQEYWVYVRATNGDSILQLPLEFLSADTMLERSNWAYALFASIYFAMVVLAIYQFVNAIMLRDLGSATLGVCMVAMMIAFHRSSPAFSPLFSLGSTTAHFSTAAISIMLASFVAFSRQLLNTRLHVPRIDGLFKAVIVLAIVMVFVIGFIPGGKKYPVMLGLLVLLLVFATSIYLGCKGDKLARNFAWGFLIPVVVQAPNTIMIALEVGGLKTFQDIAVVVSTLIFMFFMAVMHAERVRKMREEAEKDKALALISSKLARYVSPQVSGLIVDGKKDVKLEASSKEMTIFFSDIVDFTYTSEQMEINVLASWLNGYLNEMARIALNRKGTIDKFIGDAVMVFYGDPYTAGKKQDAINCVRMAIAMQKKAHSLGISIRVGINSGPTIVGDFGADDRMDYTVVGRSVNLAARLEKEAEPGRILISDSTYALVHKVIPCEENGEITVKGFAYPVKTYWVK